MSNDAFSINYARGLAALGELSYEEAVEALRSELPHEWTERYQLMCDGPTNILVVPAGGYEYLFDYSSDLPGCDREDRLVAAFGRSRREERDRDASRLRGWPGSDERGDRGHFMAHSAGGGLHINLFHQDARLNRGRSPEGRRYRAMEKYCAEHEGTFFFSRPIYRDATDRPSEIEFGVLREDVTFWVDLFANAP